MAAAALIPLRAQTFINELLSEEKEPRVSVKHTRIFLTTQAQHTHTHTHSSLRQLLGSVLHQGSKQRRAPSDEEERCPCSNVFLHLTALSSSGSIKWGAPVPPALTLRLHAVGNEGSFYRFDFWYMQIEAGRLFGLNRPPGRLRAMSFIQFSWLQTGNEGFGGHCWGEA